MRFSIRFKVVILGALVSILASTVAIVFGNFQYRNSSRQTILDNVHTWLTSIDNSLYDETLNNQYLDTIRQTRDYVDGIYKGAEEPIPALKDFKSRKYYYRGRYLWIYPIDGISMRYLSPEEREYRSIYQSTTYLLRDARLATDIASVFVGFWDKENNRLVYLMDNNATLPDYYTPYHLPGDFIEFNGNFTTDNEYLSCDFNGETTKAMPIYHDSTKSGEPIAYLFMSYNFDKVDAATDKLLRTEILTISITTVILIVAFGVLSYFFIVKNINKLKESTHAFETSLSGSDPLVIQDPNIKSHDELKDLSNSVVSLEESVINYSSALERETKEKEKINAELSIASKIQLESLNPYIYDDNKVRINSFINTAKEVGGDFYDYFYIDENRFAFVIADVSGKGVPASLFMMKAKELIKFKVSSSSSLEEAASDINNTLIDNNKEGLFVTAFIGVLDMKKNVLHYLDAGHERPFLITKKGVSQLELNTNFVFGGVKDFKYREGEIAFNKGDRLFLYTDGLNESINNEKEEFGYQRIEDNLKKDQKLHNVKIISNMDEELSKFADGQEAFDDTTILMVEYKDPKDNLSFKFSNPGFEIIEVVTNEFNEKFAACDPDKLSEVGIIIDETLNNYISYEKRKQLIITASFSLKDDTLQIVFTNNGNRFDPFTKEDKYYDKEDKEFTPGGFGIKLVKSLSSEIYYKRQNHLNCLFIHKKMK